MPTLVSELDLPELSEEGSFEQRHARRMELKDDHWLVRNMFGYAVLHYDDVTGILRDKRWHSAVSKIPQLMGITNSDFLERQQVSILSPEGNVHTRLRRLVAPAFSPRAADRLRPFMREVIDGLIDPLATSGRADIVADICDPYPIPIICELLGAPKDDWKFFSHVAEDILRIFDANVQDELSVIMAAQDELDVYVRALIDERRDKPADDLLTSLIAAEEAGDRLDNEELVMMVNAVIVGGTDTTRNQLGCCVALFAEHPEQWALLRDQPELAARAVEESMRYFGAVRGTGRFASEDLEYRGLVFPAGTLVMPSTSVANRDTAVFANPGVFDISREPAGLPNLTLGSGIHYCLGASLAKAELQEALPILARRMPDLQIDGDITWKPSTVGIYGPERLPVTFTAS